MSNTSSDVTGLQGLKLGERSFVLLKYVLVHVIVRSPYRAPPTKSKDKMVRGARRGCLRLKGGKIGINDEDDSTFTITCDHRTFHFQARDANERSQWVKCLEETISNHTPGNPVGTTGAYSKPTEEELNRRMLEAEAYFRILTQKVKSLEAQINHSSAPKSERSIMLKDSLTQMVETMGQTIELLHEAKSSLAKKVPVPVIAGKPSGTIPNSPNQSKSASSGQKSIESDLLSSRLPSSEPLTVDKPKSSEKPDTKDSDPIEIAMEVQENESANIGPDRNSVEKYVNILNEAETANLSEAGVNNSSILVSVVPINSYTSSDEEDADEFFDANDNFGEITVEDIEQSLKLEEEKLFKQTAVTNDIIDLNEIENAEKHSQHKQEGKGKEKRREGKDDEYDHGEDDEEGDGGDADMQQHGSVITHLLSQVRIGMDLTKVTLPTFILERRSLLEMYADFFAHPDLFKGIPDLTDPGDRMVQVLKWYLSSFHAGRKGSVAKKPYNPILGETFQCFFDLNDSKQQTELSTSGPIPWCTKEDVSFLAEQVSHHPPSNVPNVFSVDQKCGYVFLMYVSAFYAECESKKICFNSHIWTKSKFLGLSIGVHMVGTGNVYVSDYDEEYVMTFPNGYGRSILTVPWVELGGKTEITCKQSGYSVQLDFLTKPFYGGKRNRITAEVFAPSQKKPFMTVHGEWNGIMYSKYTDQKEAATFVDTFNMPTVNKKVKQISYQEEFESRRMWHDVTVSLKSNLIEKATEGKHKLEEKQRQDARVRKETNTKWVTRLFDEAGENEDRKFFYKWPLYKRMGLAKPGGNE